LKGEEMKKLEKARDEKVLRNEK